MRRRRVSFLLVLLAVAGSGVEHARAQAEDLAPEAVPSRMAPAAPGGAQDPAVTSSGLPRRAPEPRTMEAYWPVFAILSIAWIGIVAYLLVIGRRSRRLGDLLERTETPS